MNEKLWTLVTGGARGLGAEICTALAARGHNILIHYKSSMQEAQIVKELCLQKGNEADVIQGDFSTTDSVNKFLERLHKRFPNSIKALVNNVGNYTISSPLKTSDDEWQALFQTNLHAPIALIRSLMPTLIRKGGAVVNIGVAGINHVPAEIYSTAYTASKLALWMTSKTLAKEFAHHHVRVNMVSPGLLENAVDKEKILKLVPMMRAGTLTEVALVVAFLLAEENSYITGQNIEIGGGIRL